MNMREAFEAWYKNNFGETDFLKGSCGTYYMNSTVDFAWQTWQAALAAQAQDNPVDMFAGLEMCDFNDECDYCKDPLGGSYAKLVHNPMDVTETEFYVCGVCARKGKHLAAQAQQESQWISVEERLPEEGTFVDVYIRSRRNPDFGQRRISVLFVNGTFEITIFEYEYVSHWIPYPLPPAPEGDEE